jgi:hypothetical protein
MSVRLRGLLAEFAGERQLLDAVRRTREAGYFASCVEAYSPYPVEGLDKALGTRHHWVPFWMLVGAIGGGTFTYWLEWYSAAVEYPINVGGRPLFSWPAFVPPAVEMTILWAVLFGVGALLFGARLPRVRHPLFASHAFERATSDRFFLLVRGDDPRFDAQGTQRFLGTLSPLSVVEVAEA